MHIGHVVNAFGDSHAYAAYPYPGDIVLTAHGLSQGAAPKYPLIAQSDATQPTSDVTTGPYHLQAKSADDSSSAVAQAAAGGGSVAFGTTQSSATALHDPKTGAVTAEAETTLEGVSIAGVLSIGRVHSHAEMASTPGTPVTHSSDSEVADMTVSGQEVGLTDKGLVLAGTDVPLPPDSTANAALSAAGITVHYLAAAQTDTSTVASGFSVAVQQKVPGVGEATVDYVFGQAVASAQETGALFARAGRVVVDSRSQALQESAELQAARSEHGLSSEAIEPLHAAVAIARTRPPDELSVFKSLGIGLEDVAIAALAYRKSQDG